MPSDGDCKVAIEGGADEIAHIPACGNVSPEIAKLAANRGVQVVTTRALLQAAYPISNLRQSGLVNAAGYDSFLSRRHDIV